MNIVDAFLKIIDRIILLIKAKEENKTILFREIIEPLFVEFEKVAAQYFAYFQSVLIDINNKPIESIITSLQEQRSQYLQARIKVVSMAESIKEEITDPYILEFCDAIVQFFLVGHEEFIETRQSRGHLLLQRLYEDIEGTVVKDNKLLSRLSLYIIDTLKSLEVSLYKVSRINEKLRINYLLPGTIIKCQIHRPDEKQHSVKIFK